MDFFKRLLELPRGIPDAYPFNRAFSGVQPAQPLEAMKSRYAGSGESGGRAEYNTKCNREGKEDRRAAIV
jgi:hypothetical protein